MECSTSLPGPFVASGRSTGVIVFRQTMRFTGVFGLLSDGYETLVIDEFIGNGIGGLEVEVEAEQGGDDDGGVVEFVHVAKLSLSAT